MNKKSCSRPKKQEIITTPAYKRAGHQILDELRRRVNLAEGYELQYKRLGALLGVSKSTFSNWCGHYENRPVQFLFGLVERLPKSEREAFLEYCCREYPTLNHAAFCLEPFVVEQLHFLLTQQSGLTLIEGTSDSAVSFLLNAFGHSFPQHDATHRAVVGISCKPPGNCIPVEGVDYFCAGLTKERMRFHVERLWSGITKSKTDMVLLDGVWSLCPHKEAEILSLAGSRHVLLADSFQVGETFTPSKKYPVWRLSVRGSVKDGLQVKIDEIQ